MLQSEFEKASGDDLLASVSGLLKIPVQEMGVRPRLAGRESISSPKMSGQRGGVQGFGGAGGLGLANLAASTAVFTCTESS